MPVTGRTDFGNELSAHAERVSLHVGAIDHTLELVDRLAVESGVPAWGIKGVAMRALYPDPELRDLGDCDVMVGTVENAFALTAALRRLGYTYNDKELPWLKLDERTGGRYGQINLVTPNVERLTSVDIHFGGYSVRHCARSPEHPAAGAVPGLTRPDPWVSVVHLVGNSAGDQAVTVKDVNDLTLLLHSDDVDWNAAVRALQAVGLVPFLRTMLRRTRELAALDDAADRTARELAAGIREPVPARGWAGRHGRWSSTLAHALVCGLREGPRTAWRMSSSAAWYYRADLTLRPLPAGARARPAAWNRWTCVRLVPLPIAAGTLGVPVTTGAAGRSDGEAGFAIATTGAGLIASASGEDFVATVDGQLDVAALGAVAGALP